MLLSFQRPPHLGEKGVPSQGCTRDPLPNPGAGPMNIARWGLTLKLRAWSRSIRRPVPNRNVGVRLHGSPDTARCRVVSIGPPGCASASDRGLRRSNRGIGRRGQDRTCTITVRVRGRSSKSIRTICCQVPSTRLAVQNRNALRRADQRRTQMRMRVRVVIAAVVLVIAGTAGSARRAATADR